MAFDTEDDIGADIAAAMKGDDGGTQDAPAAAAPAPAPAAEAAPAAAASNRDETGRFAPKPAEAPAAAAAAADVQAVRPPASWSAQAKADFAALPAHVQQEVARREADFDKGRAGFESKAQIANQLEDMFASRRDQFAINGITPLQAVQRLVAAQDLLERDPRQGIALLARQYGVNLGQFAQPGPGQQQPQQAQLHPAVQALMNEVNSLKGTLTQQSQAQAQAQSQAIASNIQQFAADPKNLYFENVRGDMAALLEAKQATSLADAYEKAIWASPEIRPLLLKQQVADQAAAASAKVNQARSAGGSIAGSPAPGASPSQASNPSASVEDDVRAAFAAAGSRA